MANTPNNLEIRLTANIQDLKQKLDESTKRLQGFEQEHARIQKAVQDNASTTAQQLRDEMLSVADNMSTFARDYGQTVNKIVNAIVSASSNPNYNPYARSKTLIGNLNNSIQRTATIIDSLGSGWKSVNERLHEATARSKGIYSEYRRIRARQKSQLELAKKYQDECKKIATAKRAIAKQEKIIDDLRQKTPNGKNRKALAEAQKELNSLHGQLDTATSNYKKLKTNPELKKAQELQRLVTKNGEKESSIESALALHEAERLQLGKQQLNVQKQTTYEKERQFRLTQTQLREEQRLGDLQRRNLLNAQRDIERTRRILLRERASFMAAFGGLTAGYASGYTAHNVVRRVAESQKIQSQVDAWQLDPLQRSQFSIISDYTMNSNPGMSRKEANDATLAGMTSLGHWDYDKLKVLVPYVTKFAQASQLQGYSNDTVGNIIKNYLGVVEARQQTDDMDAMLRTFDALWKIENVTGGKVTVKDFETILRNLGPGAQLISDEGLLRLVAFAEQIKVAGHGGGGGAGAGISTVGNLVKMLQLMSAGKPTSLSAKKMLAELRDDEGNPILDTDSVQNKNTAGASTGMNAELSELWGIVNTTLGVAQTDKGLANAGFRDKNAMWEDPVKAMGQLRDPILDLTQATKENRMIFYGRDDLSGITIDDEQKAINTFIARTGLSQRVVAAATTFMNPAFLARSEHTLESTKNIQDPASLIEEQRKRGNWNVAVQDLEASFQRLAESLTPVVQDVAKLTEAFAGFLKQVAEFNENNPLFTKVNAIGLGVASLIPVLGMAAMGVENLLASFDHLADAKAAAEAKKPQWVKSPSGDGSWGYLVDEQYQTKKGGPVQTRRVFQQATKTELAGRWVTNLFNPIDTVVTNVNKKLGSVAKTAISVVGKIGSAFLKLVPIIGTAFLVYDVTAIISNWIGSIEYQGKSMIDRLTEYSQRAKDVAMFTKADIDRNFRVTEKVTKVNHLQGLKEELEEISDLGNGGVNPDEYLSSGRTVNEVLSEADSLGLLDYDEVVVSQQDLYTATNNLDKRIEEGIGALKSLGLIIKDGSEKIAVRIMFRETEGGEIVKKFHDTFNAATSEINQKTVDTKVGKTAIMPYGRDVASNSLYSAELKKTKVDAILDYIVSTTKDLAKSERELYLYLKDQEDGLALFVSVLAPKLKEVLRKSGNTAMADDEAYLEYVGKQIWKQNEKNPNALVSSISFVSEELLTNKSVKDKSGRGGRVVKGTETYKAQNPGGNGFKSVSQAEKYWTDLEAILKEANASSLGLMNADGKRDIEWARAEILKKWQAGGFALNKLTPEKSPWMKSKKGGLHKDNIDWNRRDKQTYNKSANDYASLLQEGEVAKLANTTIQSMSQTSTNALDVYRQSMDFVNSSRLSELPDAIRELENTIAKTLGNIGSGSEKNKEKIGQHKERVRTAGAQATNSVILEELSKVAVQNKNDSQTLADEQAKMYMSETQQLHFDYQRDLDRQNEYWDTCIATLQKNLAIIQASTELSNETKLEEEKKVTEALKLIEDERVKYAENAQKRLLQSHKTAGQQLVQQWTDLGKMLDDFQTTAMEGFITATEEWLDGNLDSWEDYFNQLGVLFRKQLLQAAFAPMLNQLTGLLGQGTAMFSGDGAEAQRQGFGTTGTTPTSFFGVNTQNVANWIKGWFTPSATDTTTTDNTDGVQVAADQATEAVTSVSFDMTNLWASFKGVFASVGNSLGNLGNSFMEFINSPLQSLTNAFSGACSYIGNAVISLFGAMGGSGKTSYLETALGGAFGGLINGIGKGLGGSMSNNQTKTPGLGNGEPLNLQMATSISAQANGGIVSKYGEATLKRYATGGIATSPQIALFGEGSMPEAYVPLPDGRSIPVTISSDITSTGHGVTNNIVINVSAASGGNEQQSTSSQASEDADFSRKLGQRIKQVVVQEIAQQSRPGGLLYKNSTAS